MPTEVRPNEKVSAQNGQSRTASPTVGPGTGRRRAGAPGPARRAAMRRHGSTSSSGMNTALMIANTR